MLSRFGRRDSGFFGDAAAALGAVAETHSTHSARVASSMPYSAATTSDAAPSINLRYAAFMYSSDVLTSSRMPRPKRFGRVPIGSYGVSSNVTPRSVVDLK